MDVINIESESIENIATSLINNSENLEKEIKKIQSNMEKMLTIWNGEDAKNYTQIILEKYIPNLNELAMIIKKNGAYLQKVDEIYKKLDSDFSEQKIEI